MKHLLQTLIVCALLGIAHFSVAHESQLASSTIELHNNITRNQAAIKKILSERQIEKLIKDQRSCANRLEEWSNYTPAEQELFARRHARKMKKCKTQRLLFFESNENQQKISTVKKLFEHVIADYQQLSNTDSLTDEQIHTRNRAQLALEQVNKALTFLYQQSPVQNKIILHQGQIHA
jgi:hypothetical protein